ncbi:protein kinase-like domain, concanavalin A-like lectin/glucanase domain protein [Tanacetum coccineum]
MIWYLFDPTPSGWCKTDAHSMELGSISTWEDLTTHFLAQFFPPERTSKLLNEILMFQQHQGGSLSEAWTRTEPRNKEVIKSPTKLLAPKYQEQPSSITINEKTPPLRQVHFVNTITLVKKERESRDTTPREYEGLTSEVDDEVRSNKLEEEEEDDLEYFNTFSSMKELEYHERLLKNPRPPWVRAKIRTKNLNNIKISCMIGHNLENQVYIDFDSPINVMSRRHYKQIMSQKLESRQKPTNLCKRSNFVRRVRGLKLFIVNFTYECDFMILEDTTSIIDHDLGEIAFGKPFIEKTILAYDKEEGTIVLGKMMRRLRLKCLIEWKCSDI